jgi:hypothetical protein
VAERIATSEAEALGNPVKTIDKAYAINVALFEKYPHDVLNFNGANGYPTMKDDTPADHEQVKTHVAAGRWRPAGSSVEEIGVIVPSAESLRQARAIVTTSCDDCSHNRRAGCHGHGGHSRVQGTSESSPEASPLGLAAARHRTRAGDCEHRPG